MKHLSANTKAEIAILALDPKQNMAEISKKYDISPNETLALRNHLVRNSFKIFDDTPSQNKLIQSLFEKIGKLVIEIDRLKMDSSHNS